MTFANFFSSLAGGSNLFITLPVFILVAFSAACLAERGKIRYLTIAPLALCFFIVPLSMANVIALVPACIYMIFALPGPRQRASHFEYLKMLKTFAMIFFTYLPIALFVGQRAAVENGSLLFAMTCFVGSVILLRILRHEDEVINERRFKALNLIYIAVVVLIGVVLSNEILFSFVTTILGAFFQNVIAPPISFLLTGLASLFTRLFGGIYIEEEALDDMEVFTNEDYEDADMFAYVEPLPDIVNHILSAIVILILAYFIIRIVKRVIERFSAHLGRQGSPETRMPITGAHNEITQNQKRRGRPDNPVREIYCKFLNLCKDRGMEIRPHMTSHDIQHEATNHFPRQQLSGFRDIYIKVRYSDMDCTKEDIKKAKDLYGEISRGKPE